MANKWIKHVQKYAADHNMKYHKALADPNCAKSYKSDSAKQGGLLKMEKIGKKIGHFVAK